MVRCSLWRLRESSRAGQNTIPQEVGWACEGGEFVSISNVNILSLTQHAMVKKFFTDVRCWKSAVFYWFLAVLSVMYVRFGDETLSTGWIGGWLKYSSRRKYRIFARGGRGVDFICVGVKFKLPLPLQVAEQLGGRGFVQNVTYCRRHKIQIIPRLKFLGAPFYIF